MKLNRNRVLATAVGALIASFVMSAGPNPTNVALEFSIFLTKCSGVLFLLFTCMEKEQ